MSEKSLLKCSQCGKEALDPFCIANCPKHLCEDCGPKCSETMDRQLVPEDECEECPYEPDLEEWSEEDYEEPDGDGYF